MDLRIYYYYIHYFCLTIPYLHNRRTFVVKQLENYNCSSNAVYRRYFAINFGTFVGHSKHLYSRTVYFWETTVTILSTLHTYVNTFVFNVVPVEAYMFRKLLHYWTHLWNSTFLILYSIICHSTLTATIFIFGKRKKSQRVRSCKRVVGNHHHVLLY